LQKNGVDEELYEIYETFLERLLLFDALAARKQTVSI
jgi:hypothetical protein